MARVLVGVLVGLALGVCLAVGGGEMVEARETGQSLTAADGVDRAYCRQWCSYRVCNSKGECYRVYYCCG